MQRVNKESLSHKENILDLLKETGDLGCRPAKVPLERNWKQIISHYDPPVDKKTYQHLVGKLFCLSLTQPSIAISVSLISQFMHAPIQCHMDAKNQILRYLKGSLGKGLLLKKTSNRELVRCRCGLGRCHR